MSFVAFIQEMATNSGWSKVQTLSDSLVVLPFDTDEGKINVFIQPCGQFQGKTVIEFSSPGIPVPSDKEFRLTMLEFFMTRNGKLLQGHWAIEGSGDSRKFSVMATQIAETMDPPEFEAAIRAVLREFQGVMAFVRKATQGSKVDF